MKIQVEKWIFDGERSYKIIQAEKCCDKILNSQVVVLNDEYENGDDTDYSVKLQKYEHYWDYEDEIEDYTYEPIKYCPFCGEEIEIEIVNTVDKNEEYPELKNKRKELWDKYKNTDSIKELQSLKPIINSLDKEINEMYECDGLSEI